MYSTLQDTSILLYAREFVIAKTLILLWFAVQPAKSQ